VTSTSQLTASRSPVDPATRWFGVGCGGTGDGAAAAARAAATAVAGRNAALAIVLTSLDEGFEEIVGAVRATVSPDTPIMGCTTCGEITTSGVGEGGVVVIAFGGRGFTARIAGRPQEAGGQRVAGAEVARSLGPSGRPYEVFMILADGVIGGQHELIRGVYSVIGARVPLVGAASGSLTFDDSHHFFDDGSGTRVLRGGVVAARIGSQGPIGVGVAHGWRTRGGPMNLTEVAGSQIRRIDHQPALDEYLGLLDLDDSIVGDPGGFTLCAHSNPLGISRRGGEDLHVVQAADVLSRSMTLDADVQQGSVAWLMETDTEAMIAGGADSCRQSLGALGDTPALGVISFDCAARKVQLGPEGVRREIDGMRALIGEAPLAGFFAMGEIARFQGMRGMHHMTSVTLALG
jgi:hypothetical protein